MACATCPNALVPTTATRRTKKSTARPPSRLARSAKHAAAMKTSRSAVAATPNSTVVMGRRDRNNAGRRSPCRKVQSWIVATSSTSWIRNTAGPAQITCLKRPLAALSAADIRRSFRSLLHPRAATGDRRLSTSSVISPALTHRAPSPQFRDELLGQQHPREPLAQHLQLGLLHRRIVRGAHIAAHHHLEAPLVTLPGRHAGTVVRQRAADEDRVRPQVLQYGLERRVVERSVRRLVNHHVL